MFPLQEPYIPFQQEYTVDSNIPNKQPDWLIKITWVFRKAGNRIINDTWRTTKTKRINTYT